MNKNVAVIILVSNVIFYFGILGTVYLFLLDDNTIKWLIALSCIIIGIIGSAIPDAMINVGIEQISVRLVRIELLIKYFVFFSCFSFLDIATIPTMAGMSIFLIGDLFVEIPLLKKLYDQNISSSMLIEKLKKSDTSPVDGVIKYLICNILAILLFLNIHDTGFGISIILLIACICLHAYISEKLIKKIKLASIKSRWRIRMVLWGLEAILLVLASFGKNIAVCAVFGSYYMIVSDLIMQRNTSIFHKNEQKTGR